MTEFLPVALRCHVERTAKKDRKPWPQKNPTVVRRPDRLFIIDVETSAEATQTMPGFSADKWSGLAQSLLFGRAILAERDGRIYVPTHEWVFYPDDLPSEGMQRLRDGIGALPLGDYLEPTAQPYTKLRLLPLSEFLDVLWREAVNRRCLIVGFNIAFDLGALAQRVYQTRGERFANGFGLVFWTYKTEQGKIKTDMFRPRLRYKHIDSKRAFYAWTTITTDKIGTKGQRLQKGVPSRILDLRTLIFAITSESHSLDSAAETFLKESKQHVEQHGLITPAYIRYNRKDVLLTLALTNAFLAEYDRHPISTESGGTLPETRLFSPAGVAKGYLDAMGSRARLEVQPDFPKNILGYCMTSYYGGRVEIMLRKVTVPVTHLDFLSLYPTANSLMGLWQHVISERVEVVDASEEVRRFLEAVTLADCFQPETWRELSAIALIEPQGDILPVRGHYQQDSWNIGLNPYQSDPQWYAIPDLVASKLLTGKAPRVLKAYRFIPVGQQKTLRPMALQGVVSVDPARDDFFKKVIEERVKVKKGMPPYESLPAVERDSLQVFLKILANSGSYGIYAELNRTDLSEKETVSVCGLETFTTTTTTVEVPGRYYFPPMATLVTSGARLMLTLLERCVTDAGGSYVLCDTDSMMVVAAPKRQTLGVEGRGADGRIIPQSISMLSWQDVGSIVERFSALNPYDRAVVPGSILKIEDDNYVDDDPAKPQRQLFCRAISAKRYALAVREPDGAFRVVDAKESGFGFLLNPLATNPDPPAKDSDTLRDPIQRENRKLAFAVWDAVFNRKPIPDLPWASLPCVYQLKVSSWHVYERFRRLRTLKSSWLRPGSFVLTALPDPFTDAPNGHIVASFEKAPTRWYSIAWTVYVEKDSGSVGETLRLLDPTRLPRNQVGQPIVPKDGFVARTICAYVATYLTHPEVTTLGPDGKQCSYETVGLLARRPISCLTPVYVGKEGTDIDSAESFFEASLEEDHLTYDSSSSFLDDALAVLADQPSELVARHLNVNTRTVQRWASGTAAPAQDQHTDVIRYAVELASQTLNGRMTSAASADVVLTTYCQRRSDLSEAVPFVLSRMPVRDVARLLGYSHRHAYRLQRYPVSLSLITLQRLLPTLADCCREQLDRKDLCDEDAIVALQDDQQRQYEEWQVGQQAITSQREHTMSCKEVNSAIRNVGRIRPHKDDKSREEYNSLPRHWRSRSPFAITPDEAAAVLAADYPHLGVTCENDLYELAGEYQRMR